ncbi:hypothetical protein LUW75_03375 [Streptomyces sp. MRC013]|uniref:hypothetical protein n=1 Tax=Streptomyces sp. MRC013 TaxID=2898276 RepID=UPI0020260EB0|nr:hypothetical protein [Streptomyces sp. MRC013]URM89208.1 hypothetical protein LUW75_03375 [Streptomyces sp. MRC013]
MQLREAVTADVPELIRLSAVALEGLCMDPEPADTPWRRIAHGWFEERINHRDDRVCLVVGGEPGKPLPACGMAGSSTICPVRAGPTDAAATSAGS